MSFRSVLVATFAISACAQETPQPKAEEKAPQIATKRQSMTVRNGALMWNGSAGNVGASANHRTNVVVGPTMPIGTASNSNYRILLGPWFATRPNITEQIDVLPQPERAEFNFTSSLQASWVVTLKRRIGNVCQETLFTRTEPAAGSVTGVWYGLHPGNAYCYEASATATGGSSVVAGTFIVPLLPSITTGPTFTPMGIDLGIAIDSSVATTGTFQYAADRCTTIEPTSIVFDGTQAATFPGSMMPENDFTISMWLKQSAPNPFGAQLLRTRDGNVNMTMSNGNLEVTLVGGTTLTLATGQVIPVDQWTHVALTRIANNIRLYVNGLLLGNRNFLGPINAGGNNLVLGSTTNGFQGAIAALSFRSDGQSFNTIQTVVAAGPRARMDTAGPNVVTTWNFDEPPGVQQIYGEGTQLYSGVLGIDHTTATNDPTRQPVFASTWPLGTNTMSHNVTMMIRNGGPTHCYRVTLADANGTVINTSPLTNVRRPTDTLAPIVTLTNPIVVRECTGNSSAQITLTPPMVMDNFDPNPTLEPLLNTRMGPVITFPYAFPVGATTVEWRATDASGNVGWAVPAQVVRVSDLVAPVITGGAEMVVEATSPLGTMVAPVPQSVTDACDPMVTVTHTPNRSALPLGVTTVTFTGSDDAGNLASGMRNVRVVDTTPPTFVETPLPRRTVGDDGTACFNFTPPNPAVQDNGYPANQIVIAQRRTAGPGMPTCWSRGVHTVEWTITDPAGNSRTGTQVFEVVGSTLNIGAVTFTCCGGFPLTAGTYVNSDVNMRFSVSDGTPPYTVNVSPSPTSITEAAGIYTVTWAPEGQYLTPTIFVSDSGGQAGTRVVNTSFGIDRTPPSLVDSVLDQTNVILGMTSTYPALFGIDPLDLRSFIVRDGNFEPAALGGRILFDASGPEPDRDIATLPYAAAYNGLTAFSVAGWWSSGGNGTPPNGARLLRKVDAVGETRVQVSLRNGLPRFELTIDGVRIALDANGVVTRYPPADTRYHHFALTYDGIKMRIYVDGRPVRQRIIPGTLDLGTGDITLGGGTAGMADWFGGTMAEVSTWSSALSTDDVRRHYNGGVGLPVVANAQTIALYHFGAAGQVVRDDSANALHGALGTSTNPEASDARVEPLSPTADPTASGVASVVLTLSRQDMGQVSEVVNRAVAPFGVPLATSPPYLGGHTCTANPGGACIPPAPLLSGSDVAAWDAATNFPQYYLLSVQGTDAANNPATTQIAFRTTDYETTLQESINTIQMLLADPLYSSFIELDDARLDARAALTYAQLSRPYDDGSYLRADRAIDGLFAAFDVGVTPALAVAGDIAQALASDVEQHLDALRPQLEAVELPILAKGDALLEDAKFECAARSWRSCVVFAREAYDAIAVLHWRSLRSQQRATNAAWQTGLASFSAGGSTLEELRLDTPRDTAMRQMLMGTQVALVQIYEEVNQVLAESITTQRVSLTELIDVIRVVDATETGDLVRIGALDPEGCIDRLANLRLPDDQFTECYLRLNDMVRTLDSVSEALVHTKRWQAGMAVALFNMLELSMNVSPTGLPFVATNSADNDELVLPDAQAATVNFSVALTSVDQPDRALEAAYARYDVARTALDAGEFERAFALFVDERCLLLNLYNRYYSSNRMTNVSAPMEAPIVPSSVGCGTTYNLTGMTVQMPARGAMPANFAENAACAAGQVMTGATITTDATGLASFAPQCSRLDVSGTLVGPTTLPAIGTPGPNVFQDNCPAGQFVIGLHGRATAAGVTALGVRCATVVGWTLSGASEPPLPARGATAGGTPFDDRCGANHILATVDGTATYRGTCTSVSVMN